MELSGKQMSGYEDIKYHLAQAKWETHDHAVGHTATHVLAAGLVAMTA